MLFSLDLLIRTGKGSYNILKRSAKKVRNEVFVALKLYTCKISTQFPSIAVFCSLRIVSPYDRSIIDKPKLQGKNVCVNRCSSWRPEE